MKATMEKQQSLKRSLVELLDNYRLSDKEFQRLLAIQTEILTHNISERKVNK